MNRIPTKRYRPRRQRPELTQHVRKEDLCTTVPIAEGRVIAMAKITKTNRRITAYTSAAKMAPIPGLKTTKESYGIDCQGRKEVAERPAAGPARPRRKAIARVGKHWKHKAAVIVKRGGREICNPATPEGRAEYFWRKLLMLIRQEGFCCNCPYLLRIEDMTFEHENGRGAAKRDDRIALMDDDGRFLRHINGVSHADCNQRRGSRRTEIEHGNNTVLEIESL